MIRLQDDLAVVLAEMGYSRTSEIPPTPTQQPVIATTPGTIQIWSVRECVREKIGLDKMLELHFAVGLTQKKRKRLSGYFAPWMQKFDEEKF